MSRVVVFDEFGGPEVLHLVDEPPVEPGEGEVRIAIQASAVNPLDALMRAGTSPGPVTLPHARLGIEATGTIEALGTGVTDHRVGDPVIVTAIPDATRRGSYAEHTIVPAAHVIPRPAELDVVRAAASWVAFATAYGSLVEWAQLQPGDQVLISGASGSVGRMAIQIANFVGATPIALTRSSDRTHDLVTAGAAHVIATDRDDVVTAARRLTGGKGVDVALDLVRGPGQRTLIDATQPDGTLVAAGFLDPRPTPDADDSAVTIMNYRGWDHLLDTDRMARTVAFFGAGIRHGTLRPEIDSVHRLGDVVAAHRRFDEGRNGGKKIVLAVR